MKLLVITQKVDRDDPVLGFFHGWIKALSFKYNFVTVVCLGKGEYDLPSNVKVLSLGKENIAKSLELKAWSFKKIKYIIQFLNLSFFQSLNYDAVFVHMNEEYVLLGGLLWKLLGKKIYLWRNHKQGSFLTRFAVLLSNKVFYTSKDSFTAQFEKAIKMPVGVDIEKFKDGKMERLKNSVLSLGRIGPVKNLDLFIDALKILKERKVDFEVSIYGDALPKDQKYIESLKEKAKNIEQIKFHSGVPNYKTPEIYNKHEIFVNLTPSGSFDKTILEAAACGCLPVILNTSLRGEIEKKLLVKSDSPEEIANTLEYWLKANREEKEIVSKKLQEYVFQNHSLDTLMIRLVDSIGK